jgi:hypothetical protein
MRRELHGHDGMEPFCMRWQAGSKWRALLYPRCIPCMLAVEAAEVAFPGGA